MRREVASLLKIVIRRRLWHVLCHLDVRSTIGIVWVVRFLRCRTLFAQVHSCLTEIRIPLHWIHRLLWVLGVLRVHVFATWSNCLAGDGITLGVLGGLEVVSFVRIRNNG